MRKNLGLLAASLILSNASVAMAAKCGDVVTPSSLRPAEFFENMGNKKSAEDFLDPEKAAHVVSLNKDFQVTQFLPVGHLKSDSLKAAANLAAKTAIGEFVKNHRLTNADALHTIRMRFTGVAPGSVGVIQYDVIFSEDAHGDRHMKVWAKEKADGSEQFDIVGVQEVLPESGRTQIDGLFSVDPVPMPAAPVKVAKVLVDSLLLVIPVFANAEAPIKELGTSDQLEEMATTLIQRSAVKIFLYSKMKWGSVRVSTEDATRDIKKVEIERRAGSNEVRIKVHFKFQRPRIKEVEYDFFLYKGVLRDGTIEKIESIDHDYFEIFNADRIPYPTVK